MVAYYVVALVEFGSRDTNDLFSGVQVNSLRLVVSQACDYPYSQAYGLNSRKLFIWEAVFGREKQPLSTLMPPIA